MTIDLASMFLPAAPILEKLLRPIVVYAAIVVLIHWAGKRELAQVNTLDLVVLLLLSNVVQNAMIGDDNSIGGALVGALTLVGVNRALVYLLYRRGKLAELLEGQPSILIKNGQIIPGNLDRELMRRDELLAALRRQGVSDPSEVAEALLENSGAISVIQRRPTPDEQQHAELLARLEELTREVRAWRAGPSTAS